MLEISSLFDAHFHLFDANSYENPAFLLNSSLWKKGCTCFHSVEEWNEGIKTIEENKGLEKKLVLSFGIHPQTPDVLLVPFLEQLAAQNKIQAVGECGFDFFTKELKGTESVQEELFAAQVELAARYGKPLVIHLRKGLEKIFGYSSLLQKVPAILFHSFPGSNVEAESILRKLPDSYFSFGKQIMNGNKKTVSCIQKLPLEKLLLETDAPFQTLKGETFTSVQEIQRVYVAAQTIRAELSCDCLERNFNKLFM